MGAKVAVGKLPTIHINILHYNIWKIKFIYGNKYLNKKFCILPRDMIVVVNILFKMTIKLWCCYFAFAVVLSLLI